MPLIAIIATGANIDFTGPPISNAVPTFIQGRASDIILSNGAASNQSTLVHSSVRTVLAGANDDLDLTGTGGILDPFGARCDFTTIKAILIRSDAANTTVLTVGGGVNPFVGPLGATGTIQVRPGGTFEMVAPQTGFTVTAATADILRIANAAGASATYSIMIIGA